MRLVDIGQGRIVATIDGPSLAKAVGVDVRFTPGEVQVHKRIQGVDVTARGKVTVQRNVVKFTPTSVEGFSLPLGTFAVTYTIPGIEILPCQADVQVVQDGLVLACTVSDVPPVLLQAAQLGL